MRRPWSVIIAIVAALTLVAAACGDDDDASGPIETGERPTTEATDGADGTEEAGTIVDVAVGAGTFTTLVAAVQEAGLVDTLSGPGPFTVFAPSDDAFAAFLADAGLSAEELLASPDLGDILTYHVVSGTVLASDVVALDGTDVETVNGATVAVSVDGDTVSINDATVVATDIEASNGVIHVIDSVLLPPS